MFRKELDALGKKGLLRSIVSRSSPQGSVIRIGRRRYVNFSSNDYLGLADHPLIIKAAADSLKQFGFGSGASRLLAGGGLLFEELERTVSAFKGTDAAATFNSGYAANTGIIPAIASEGDLIFSDELNHASIIDGCRLSRARTVVYRHCDAADLEKKMRRRNRRGRCIVVTDSVFSMDGDIAPLPDIAGVCSRQGAILYIDEAHATGVLGGGRGSLAHFGMNPEPWMIQMGTFSKACGSYGAFAAADRTTIDWICNSARSFLFSTALPACVIAASLAAIRLIVSDSRFIESLWMNRELLIRGIADAGYDIFGSSTPIVPIGTRSVKEALLLADFLFKRGIYAPAIRPPTVRKPRIRLTVSAAHTDRQILLLVKALQDYRRPT